MFEYYGHTYVFCPGAGADNPLGPKYFNKHEYSVHLLIPSIPSLWFIYLTLNTKQNLNHCRDFNHVCATKTELLKVKMVSDILDHPVY